MCENKSIEAIKNEASLYNRWEKLKSNYVNSDFILRVIRFQELLNTRLSINSNSLELYVIDIRNKTKELKRISTLILD